MTRLQCPPYPFRLILFMHLERNSERCSIIIYTISSAKLFPTVRMLSPKCMIKFVKRHEFDDGIMWGWGLRYDEWLYIVIVMKRLSLESVLSDSLLSFLL
jgi:hypothetical protein